MPSDAVGAPLPAALAQQMADGALYLVRQPLALVVLVLLVLLVLAARELQRRGLRAALAAFVAGAALCAWLPVMDGQGLVGPACLATLGVLLATGWRMPAAAVVAGAGVGGVALGVSAGLQTATAAEAAGTIGAAVLLMGLAWVVHHRAAQRWSRVAALRLAPRVLAAWGGAVGLLMLALRLAGKGG